MQVGQRPTTILEIDDGWFENLMMDAAILRHVTEEANVDPEDLSLSEEIKLKRKYWAQKYR